MTVVLATLRPARTAALPSMASRRPAVMLRRASRPDRPPAARAVGAAPAQQAARAPVAARARGRARTLAGAATVRVGTAAARLPGAAALTDQPVRRAALVQLQAARGLAADPAR